MNIRKVVFSGLFLIVALILIAQPVAAGEFFSGTGYEGVLDYVGIGEVQSYSMDVMSGDDFTILALIYSQANDYDLYVYDSSGTLITSATAPYSTENGLNYIWAVSTRIPGRYVVKIHSTSGSGYFAFIHFNKNMQTQTGTSVTTTPTPTTIAPTTVTPTPIVTTGKISGDSSSSLNKLTIINQNDNEGTYYEVVSSAHSYTGYINPGDEVVITGIYSGKYEIYVKYGTGWNAATKSFATTLDEGSVADPGMTDPKIITFPSGSSYNVAQLTIHSSGGNVHLV